jgi:hypothetical protein
MRVLPLDPSALQVNVRHFLDWLGLVCTNGKVLMINSGRPKWGRKVAPLIIPTPYRRRCTSLEALGLEIWKLFTVSGGPA